MALYSEKYHYLIIKKDIANDSIDLGKKTLHAEAEQKLLGIIIDKDLKFESVKKLIIKQLIKSNPLIRVAPSPYLY